MRPSARSKVTWAVWMTGGGVATSLVVWVLTDSILWALVALLASGPVLSSIGQMVMRPVHALQGAASERDGPH